MSGNATRRLQARINAEQGKVPFIHNVLISAAVREDSGGFDLRLLISLG